MFDLLGDTVPTPLPTLELENSDVTPDERENWERELLGTPLSEGRLSVALRRVASDAATLCSEITPEMDKQRVLVVGQVSSFRTGTTRRGDPYGAAVLNDMGGSVEVMAWSEVFQRTEELWATGNILMVEGKVKAREDNRVSIYCESVQRYEQPSEESEEEESPPLPSEPSSEVVETGARPQEPGPLQMWLKVTETEDQAGDLKRLQDAISLAREYPGQDRVLLEVEEGQRKVRLEMPELTIGYCSELHQRMAYLLGGEGRVVEKAR